MNVAIKLLTSTKFAVAVLGLIIALAAFGTIYPGGDAIFGSWLFLPFIGLLALSTVTCSLTRIGSLWRAVTYPTLEVDDQFFKQLPYHTTLTGVSISQFKAHLKGFKWYESTSSETTFVFAQKGRIGRFGPYIAHFGVLILLLGVVVAAAFGHANPYNDTITVIPVGGSQQIDGFVLRLDSFNVSYYDTGAVREYKATVTIIDSNQVQTSDITINGPTSYKGLTFLLYGYDSQGVIESGKASWVAFQIKNDTGIPLVWTGAAVTLLGITLSLYISHKRLWIKVYKEQITLGAMSNKSVARFLKDIDDLCAKLADHS
ncbi:MAG: cytochrome c biogenesis protein ResB [Halobacteriota archaeon]